jgi:hypothetical protein
MKYRKDEYQKFRRDKEYFKTVLARLDKVAHDSMWLIP